MEKRQWKSIDHFNKVQKRWSLGGAVFLVMVILLGFFIGVSGFGQKISKASTARSLEDNKGEMICNSNAYLVDEKYYYPKLDIDSRTPFDKFPVTAPDGASQIFEKAQSLPINASRKDIEKLFVEKSTMSSFGKSLQKYAWDFVQGENNYHLSITRTFGCISQISISVYPQQNPNDITTFIQMNKIPTGHTVVKLNDNPDYCKKRRLSNQQFVYLKNNRIPESDIRDIPDFANKLFIQFNYFNNGRDKLYEKIGQPNMLNGTTYQWLVKDENGLDFNVTLNTIENCENRLEISWYSPNGEHCILRKENIY